MNVVKEFSKLFDGLQRVRGSYKVDPKDRDTNSKVIGAAKTVKETLEEIHWRNHLNGIEGLGVVPIRDDQNCVFAALDIDDYKIDKKKLNAKLLASYSFFFMCRTKSNGIHLYCFFKSPANAERVRDKLKEIALSLGLKPDTEIFPKQKKLAPDGIGNWINLPYYDVNGPTTRYAYRSDDSRIADVEEFIKEAKARRIDPEEFFDYSLREGERMFLDGPPCLQTLHMQEGGFGTGSRNNSLFNVGVYLKRKHGDDWKDRLEDFNAREINPPLKAKEVHQTQDSLDKDKYFYKCNDAPICNVCDSSKCKSRLYGIGGEADGENEWREAVSGIQIGRREDLLGKLVVEDDTVIKVAVYEEELSITYDVLTNQRKMQQQLALNFRKYPMGVSMRKWEKLLRDWIENSVWFDLELSDTRMGNIYDALCDFCSIHGGADTRDEVIMGKVFMDGDAYVFAKSAFRDFLVRRGVITSRDASQKEVNKIYALMRKNMGLEDRVFKYDSKNNKVTQAWRVNIDLIDNRNHMPPVKTPETDF